MYAINFQGTGLITNIRPVALDGYNKDNHSFLSANIFKNALGSLTKSRGTKKAVF